MKSGHEPGRRVTGSRLELGVGDEGHRLRRSRSSRSVGAVDFQLEYVEAVVVADDVVEHPALDRRVGVAVGVDDPFLVFERVDPAAVRADRPRDAVPGVRVVFGPDRLADLRRAELLGDDVVEAALIGVGGGGQVDVVGVGVVAAERRAGGEVGDVHALAVGEQGVPRQGVDVLAAVEGAEPALRGLEGAQGGAVAAGPHHALGPGRDQLAVLAEVALRTQHDVGVVERADVAGVALGDADDGGDARVDRSGGERVDLGAGDLRPLRRGGGGGAARPRPAPS